MIKYTTSKVGICGLIGSIWFGLMKYFIFRCLHISDSSSDSQFKSVVDSGETEDRCLCPFQNKGTVLNLVI